VDMSSRKALIKDLLAEGAEFVTDPTPWLGDMTVCTSNTSYRFSNGVCTAVQRFDEKHGRTDFLGMRLVGWLVDEETEPRISAIWRPGASALLLRKGLVRDSLALTSPTCQIRRSDSRLPAQPPPPLALSAGHPMKKSGVVARRVEPPTRFAAADSMTRIGVVSGGRR
jgi:hypothetical protein